MGELLALVLLAISFTVGGETSAYAEWPLLVGQHGQIDPEGLAQGRKDGWTRAVAAACSLPVTG